MDIVHLGIVLAFVAMFSWGIGDFFIQRSVRKVGDWEALFFVTAFGAMVLSPFVWRNLPVVFDSSKNILVIGILCLVLFFAAILDFEALRIGKLSVVEPAWSVEVPVSALMAFIILSEHVSTLQIILIISLFLGLFFVSFKNDFNLQKIIFEKGFVVAFFGAILMGAANFFMGWGSRLVDSVSANFLSDLFIAIVTGIFLIFSGRLRRSLKDFFLNRKILLMMSISDKIAWLAFAFAMSLAPIGIVVALSESYIIVAVILGLFVNKEKIRLHQKIGLVLAVVSVVTLATITG